MVVLREIEEEGRNYLFVFTNHHDRNKVVFAGEDVALPLHTLTDGSGYQSNTLDQTELHGQVLN